MYKFHNDYPLAPEKLEISHNMLPKYCSNIANEYEIKKTVSVNNLVPNIGSKSKYVFITEIFSCTCHYE